MPMYLARMYTGVLRRVPSSTSGGRDGFRIRIIALIGVIEALLILPDYTYSRYSRSVYDLAPFTTNCKRDLNEMN